jgi:hypothetical protein
MGRRAMGTLLASTLLLAPAASAETFRILSGELTDAETGAGQALTGSFDASVFDAGEPPEGLLAVEIGGSGNLLVDSFQLEAGGRSFTPRAPIEYEGLTPVFFPEPANQINVEEDGSLGLVFLRSGGELVAESEDEVTFRFLDFRGSGSAAGEIGDAGLPRRLELHGTLYEVDQRFRVLRGDDCGLPGLPPFGGGDGGAVIEIGGGGNLVVDGGVVLASPQAVVFGPVTSAAAPTLEELGISAPSGAEVSYDDFGALTVTTEGDLVIEDLVVDLPGLSSVTLVAGGNITISGSVMLPADVDLTLEAEGDVSIPSPGGGIGQPLPPPIGIPLCMGLRPIVEPRDPGQGPDLGRELASFSLVATAAQPAAIDVWPGSPRRRVMPGFRQLIPVAILGDADLDVRDVDLRSLRFGPGEAGPRRLHRFRGALRRDVNRDRVPDLVVWFGTRQAEIAYGDTTVCLHGETYVGTLFEGCDTIDTRPVWRRRPGRDLLRHR